MDVVNGHVPKRVKKEQKEEEIVDLSQDDDDDDEDAAERMQLTQPIDVEAMAAATAQVSSTPPLTAGALYFDGGSRGNPGIAGCGAVLYDKPGGEEVWSLSAFIGKSKTNNDAEYEALIHGLEKCVADGITHLQAYGDSQLIVNQVNGQWKVKKPELQGLHKRACALKKRFQSFALSYIPREQNTRADQLANRAMDQQNKAPAIELPESFDF